MLVNIAKEARREYGVSRYYVAKMHTSGQFILVTVFETKFPS